MWLFSTTFAVAILSCATAGVVPQLITNHSITRSRPRAHAQGNGADISTGTIITHPAIAFWDDETASAADFEKFTSKGGALMCGLRGTDLTAGRLMKDKRIPASAASAWSGDLRQELRDWYWHDVDTSSKACQIDEFWKLTNTMQALGLDGKPKSNGGDNSCYNVQHWDSSKQENGRQVPAINQWYTVGDTNYRSTGAHFEFNINIKGGAIYGLYLDNPQSAASMNWYGNKKVPDLALLPHLRALSDVLWSYWVRENPDIKNIRYFFMLGISNDQTNQLIASSLQHAKKQLSPWPGISFSADTDEGHALLGSPNGAAFAYFLMQHKAQLGYKTITKITVIRSETDDDNDFVDASLVFHVEDASESPADDQDGANVERRDGYTVKVIRQGKDSMIRVHMFRG